MIINSTNKTRTNNYSDNTECVAMVVVTREMSATDTLTLFTVEIENLSKIIDIMMQVRGPDGDIIGPLPRYLISGNQITVEDDETSDFVNAIGNVFTFFVFGK